MPFGEVDDADYLPGHFGRVLVRVGDLPLALRQLRHEFSVEGVVLGHDCGVCGVPGVT